MRTSVVAVLTLGLFVCQAYGGDSDHDDHNSEQPAEQGGGHEHNWTYNIDRANSGPEMWADMYSGCDASKRRQSPINIELDHVRMNTKLSELYVEVEDAAGETLLGNNGHGAGVKVEGQRAFLNGGGLAAQYRIQQFHFHWGSGDTEGSEHQINGKTYPLEMHFVTYNSEKFDGLLAAAGSGEGDALAVIGTLFEISEEDNPAFEPIISHLSEIIHPSDTTLINVTGNVVIDNILPKNLVQYYTYPGSLTTPGCFETVMWYVLNQTQTISASQLSQFRMMHEGEEDDGTMVIMMDNFRPVQPLYGRVIESSFNQMSAQVISYRSSDGSDGDAASSITGSASLIIALISCVVLLCLKH